MRADRLILAGLEEGVWPQRRADRSRSCRGRCARRSACRRPSAASACPPTTSPRPPAPPEVILLHTERRGGQPAVTSRWLWRLETLAQGRGPRDCPGRDRRARLGPRPGRRRRPAARRPQARAAPRAPPAAGARGPRELSVTRVETLVRDPYAVYASACPGPAACWTGPTRRSTPARAAPPSTRPSSASPTPGPTPCPPTRAARVRGLYLRGAERGAELRRPPWPARRRWRATRRAWLADFETRRRARGATCRCWSSAEISLVVPARATSP